MILSKEIQKRVDQLVAEGLSTSPVRRAKPSMGLELEGKIQAIYFSILRNDMNTYVASRIFTVGRNKEADLLFQELFREEKPSSPLPCPTSKDV